MSDKRLSKQQAAVLRSITRCGGLSCHPDLWTSGERRTLESLAARGLIRRDLWSNKWRATTT